MESNSLSQNLEQNIEFSKANLELLKTDPLKDETQEKTPRLGDPKRHLDFDRNKTIDSKKTQKEDIYQTKYEDFKKNEESFKTKYGDFNQKSARPKNLQKSLELNFNSYRENLSLASRPMKSPIKSQLYPSQFDYNKSKQKTDSINIMYSSQTNDFYSKYRKNPENIQKTNSKFEDAYTMSVRNRTSDLLRKYDEAKFVLHINKRYNMAAKFNNSKNY